MVKVIKLKVTQGDEVRLRTLRDHTETLYYLIGMIEIMTNIKIHVEYVDEDDPIYSVTYGR